MEEVPIQDFQSVIAIELGAAGALLWEIGFFGGGKRERGGGSPDRAGGLPPPILRRALPRFLGADGES